jgi:hypothetical protein
MTDQLLLDYNVSTSPVPLQAGSANSPGQARISIEVVPRGKPVYCDEIQIAVPGDDSGGKPYFTQRPVCSSKNGKWAVISVVAPKDDTNKLYRFTLRTIDEDDNLMDDSLEIVLTGTLGAATGTLTCDITEHTSTDENVRGTRKTTSLALPVITQPSYLHNFITYDVGKPTLPRTRFSVSDEIYLTWESNGTSFTVYDGDGTLLYKGADTHLTLPDPGSATRAAREFVLSQPTTFVVVAEFTNSGFEPTYLNATVTVTVTNPVFTGLTVQGLLRANQDLQVRHPDYSMDKLTTVDTSGITVSGQTTLDSGCKVNGLLSVSGDLTVSSLYGRQMLTTTAGADLAVAGAITSDGRKVVLYSDEIFLSVTRERVGDSDLYLFVTDEEKSSGAGRYVCAAAKWQTNRNYWTIESR